MFSRSHSSVRSSWLAGLSALSLLCVCGLAHSALAQPRPPAQPDDEGKPGKPEPEFKPFAEVSKDFAQVVSTADGIPSLYTIWKREKDGQLLAELPRNWQSQRQLFAMTVPTGELFAGLQAGDMYVYWKRFDKRMALIAPQVDVRSTGDTESKDSIKNHFVDRVIIDVPIECMGPNGNPVIDLDNLLIQNASVFYGGLASNIKTNLVTISSCKAFPKNVEISFTAPARAGQLKTFHYSISQIEDDPTYKPRVADERVGYFTTTYRDLGKFRDDQVETRYINRWKVEKKDAGLKLSPPKEPIIYYVEHTVPARYRRWIKEGTLYWNKAFEKVGIKDAIEVYYQDKESGANMEKDPEDVRYNFIRWLSNDIGTAIGPSRAHPLTGQILDADVVLTDGWIRHFWYQANELAPNIAMEGMSAETLAWLDTRPSWDPRILLAAPEQREQMIRQRAQEISHGGAGAGITAYGGRAIAMTDATVATNPALRNFVDMINPPAGLCLASEGMARDMALSGMYLDVMNLIDAREPGDEKKDEKKDDKDKADKPDKLDGIPEWFIGPALAHLTVHEVGHTLGLRHNFKASSQFSLKEINSPELKGKPYVASVMDYTPVNINTDESAVQGDYHMIGIGSYDEWAIEYGYTAGDTKDVLKKVSEPGHDYLTDEDTGGPDPLARRYDFAADPLNYSKSLIKLANGARTKILDKFVKDGESWSRARRGYQITLSTQLNAVNIMANWVGGANINRDRKGDPNARPPITPISPSVQREAMKFCIDNSFNDDAYGLSPELLTKLTVNKDEDAGADPTWSVNDQIGGIQASTLTLLMNPTRLRRVYNNEAFTPADQEAFTLPEMLDTLTNAIWTELDKGSGGSYTARKPMISSLRRNLQREYTQRLIDLSLDTEGNAAGKTIATLSRASLQKLNLKIAKLVPGRSADLDPYTSAHLSELSTRITKALDAQYLYNGQNAGGGFPFFLFFGQPAQQPLPGTPRNADDH